jgi:hypothetical protein
MRPSGSWPRLSLVNLGPSRVRASVTSQNCFCRTLNGSDGLSILPWDQCYDFFFLPTKWRICNCRFWLQLHIQVQPFMHNTSHNIFAQEKRQFLVKWPKNLVITSTPVFLNIKNNK